MEEAWHLVPVPRILAITVSVIFAIRTLASSHKQLTKKLMKINQLAPFNLDLAFSSHIMFTFGDLITIIHRVWKFI